MELSSEPSNDEGIALLRQVYRAGQTPPAGVPTAGSATQEGEVKPPSRGKRRILKALAVLLWLLLLGGISFYLFLPDLDEVSSQLKAIREDPNLTIQQKFEKSREVYSKLTPEQSKQVVQSDMKKVHHQRNAEMHKFLKMTPEEQTAYMKKLEEDRKQFRAQFGGMPFGPGGPKPGNGPVPAGGGGGPVTVGGKGGGMSMGVRMSVGGPGGGQTMFIGPAFPDGGGPRNPAQMQKNMLDHTSPETRAGAFYQRGLLQGATGGGRH